MDKPFAALVDWGTSNFRLWLVDADARVISERQSHEGLQAITDRNFSNVLESHLDALGAPGNLPVMIAGMAGARTGWIEAPYLTVPVSLGTMAGQAVRIDDAKRPAFILPGICQREPLPYDVMRGEETQLAGAVALGHADGLFCMPGTHSKWAVLQDEKLVRFNTVMTGELFDLIARQSILKLSMAGGDASADARHPAYRDAVLEAFGDGFSITASLFSIRAGNLLANIGPEAAASRLSGLLIGSEIAAMKPMAPADAPVRLVGSARLTALYSEALKLAGLYALPLDGSELVRRGLFAAASGLFT